MESLMLYIVIVKSMTLGFQTVLIAHAIVHLSHTLNGKLYIGLIVGYAGYCLIALSSVSSALNQWLFLFVLLSSISPMFFWLLTNSLNQENFTVHKVYWLLLIYIAAAAPVGGVIYQIGVEAQASIYRVEDWVLFYIPNGVNTLFLIFGLQSILNNWRLDLVEAQRWLWITVVPFVGVTMIIPLLVILLSGNYLLPLWMEATQASYIFLMFFVIVLWLLDADLRHIAQTKAKAWLMWLGWGDETDKPYEGENAIDQNSFPASDKNLLEQLESLMKNEHYFRQHKLSVKDLASKLTISEQELRRLINQNLGYRNFNDFVNNYRIQYVIEALGDPNSNNLPIMTIALDSGFSSIAPFNRAFKEKTGVAPIEYRARLMNTVTEAV